MLEKTENLNINDLDVQELENRLEMAMMEAAESRWVHIGESHCSDVPHDAVRPCGPNETPH